MKNKERIWRRRRQGIGQKLLCGTLAFSLCLGMGTAPLTVNAAEGDYIKDADLKDNATEAPAVWGAVPSKEQYQYQKEELAAFCHFGPNTFNDVEWGDKYGDKKPSEIFTLDQDFDAETLVTTLQDAGFKKIIVTAKHHDGFCIWNSKYTDYDIAETNYKDGNGDILAEISAACTEHNMNMGLYLSPWDIHEPSYGYYDESGKPTDKEHDAEDYNKYYNNQLEEILSSEKYGNDGHFNEIWMDGAKGNGSDAQDYDFETFYQTIQKYEPGSMTYKCGKYSDVVWVGNEDGRANSTTWSKGNVTADGTGFDAGNYNNADKAKPGYETGKEWTIMECDARITSGWFWGPKKNTPKSITDLGNMYFQSVGRNATLLLNIPPNDQGTVDQAILNRVTEFGQEINETFEKNLAEGAEASASEVYKKDAAYKAGNVLDGRDETYWAAAENSKEASLIIDFEKEKSFDVVSLEEAIQLGQRISEYTVEYRSDNGEWRTFAKGTTVGAKRLNRGAAVTADQIKITVKTNEGHTPMLSEVGVYKASKNFSLGGVTAPEGMEILDVADETHFNRYQWELQYDPKYINGTNIWSSKGDKIELTFEGSKVYLLGSTKASSAGTADIYIDGKKEGNFNRVTGKDAFGQVLYASGDLKDGKHTLELRKTSGTIALEAAYVVNNGEKGMLELGQTAYTMNEDDTLDVVIKRVGGTKGQVTARLEPNPGTAVQGDFDYDPIPVTIEDGENSTTVQVKTKRNENQTGDLEFSVELTTPSEDLIIGFDKKAVVKIIDAEGVTLEKLQKLVDECERLQSECYTDGWEKLQEKLAEVKELIAAGETDRKQIQEAYSAVEQAKAGLVPREKYTAEDPFYFPWKSGDSATLEGEFATTIYESNQSDKYKVGVREADWASNGKYINNLNVNDRVEYSYYAEKAGTYQVTLTYQSGSNSNKLTWKEKDGKITAGEAKAGASNASEVHTAVFEMEVVTPGAGTIIFTGPSEQSPRLDKFVIEPKNVELGEYKVTAVAGEGGTITPEGTQTVTEGETLTYQIVPKGGYQIADVRVDGQSVGPVESYTMQDISKDSIIEAEFALVNYTEENRYQFPTEVEGTPTILEAEHFILTNSGNGEQYPLKRLEADWASNGLVVNNLNENDKITLPYHAEVAGKYEVTVLYRSGADENKLVWAEEDGKILAGEVSAGAHDGAKESHTAVFVLDVQEAGNGMLVFTGPAEKSPRIDKFDIVLKEAKEPVVPEPEEREYTITATAGEGGSITPSGEVVVKEGAEQTFAIVAEEGYEIEDVVVNGESKGALTEYTFTNVEADGTISVTFKKTETKPPVEPENPNPDKPNTGKPDTDKPDPDKPNTGKPDASDKPSTEKPPKAEGAVQTGDETSVFMMLVLLGVSTIGILVVIRGKSSVTND